MSDQANLWSDITNSWADVHNVHCIHVVYADIAVILRVKIQMGIHVVCAGIPPEQNSTNPNAWLLLSIIVYGTPALIIELAVNPSQIAVWLKLCILHKLVIDALEMDGGYPIPPP